MSTDDASASINSEQQAQARPQLPPRPPTLSLISNGKTISAPRPALRAGLVSSATTAVSRGNVRAVSRVGSLHDLKSSVSHDLASPTVSKPASRAVSEAADDSSVKSTEFSSDVDVGGEQESLFGDGIDQRVGGTSGFGTSALLETDLLEDEDKSLTVDFGKEFEAVSSQDDQQDIDYDKALEAWKCKRKHFLILSAAGKPIYTRHGSDAVISSYVGIMQTIISSYNEWKNSLHSFRTAHTTFVILSQTNLFLVAITSLAESEGQLRAQLEALYMQILSTLTLPTLTHIFSVRPSSDLRRPLQGTEVLLSALADSFTRGSPSTLLGSLESLRLRKAHRQIINNTMLKSRVESLLYGLIVAGGRLVSVIRPKKHSLHPGDLHLIFNMLFEAEGIKAGGGESFIPLCLPGFNNKGYLYMYVSFLNVAGETVREPDVDEQIAKEDAVAIILLSADKESFESLQSMKNYLVYELRKNGGMRTIHHAVQLGRPQPTDIVPGTVLRHFLYKSKGNVQFFMPAFDAISGTLDHRRQLFSIYQRLHASAHAKHAAVKVHHVVSSNYSALAWTTPMFELYCIAGAGTPRNALAQNANTVIKYIEREEERIFLIGGAVF